MTTTEIVGAGSYTYEMDVNWAKLPEGWKMPAAAVYGDSQDRVYCFNRDPDHPVMIFDREGNLLSHWGAGLFPFPHAIILDKDDNVWLVERNDGQIMKFTSDGQLLMTIGLKGFRSDTGADNSDFSSNGWKQVTHGGNPFNLPAGIALNEAGRDLHRRRLRQRPDSSVRGQRQVHQVLGRAWRRPRAVQSSPWRLD